MFLPIPRSLVDQIVVDMFAESSGSGRKMITKNYLSISRWENNFVAT
jgi:hypothetical protein